MMLTHCPKAWLVSVAPEDGLNTIHTPTGKGGMQLHVKSGQTCGEERAGKFCHSSWRVHVPLLWQ